MATNPYKESNFKIQTCENGFLVRSDSARFGNNEIVYQGISYEECLGYIGERVDNIEPTYYVIKDLASWRGDVRQRYFLEKSEIERFETVEGAIKKFNEYKEMDYLKQIVINPDSGSPARRLVFGVSYAPHEMAELDLLHTENDKTLLISDIVEERENGYERFMTNSNFIRDLNKIANEIRIDEYSFYRDRTLEELAGERLEFLRNNYPEEVHTEEEAMAIAEQFVKKRPNYLKSNKVNERVPYEEFHPPYLNVTDKIREFVPDAQISRGRRHHR